MTQSLQEAWASMEELGLTERKKQLKLYNQFKKTPHWFYYNGTVTPLEVGKMTQAGNVQIRGGTETRKRHVLTIRNNTWLDIYESKEEATRYAIADMKRLHKNAQEDIRTTASAVQRLTKELEEGKRNDS